MPANNKHMTVDGFIEVLGDLQTKADGRFAQGGGITFSVDENNLISATNGEDEVIFPGGGSISTVSAYTILASGWSNGTYSLESSYPHSRYNLSIAPCSTMTSAQMSAYQKAQIVGDISTNVLTALGTVPAIDIPVMLTVTTMGSGGGGGADVPLSVEDGKIVITYTEGD